MKLEVNGILRLVNKGFALIGMLILIIVVILISYGVLTRYLFHSPVVWSIEVPELLQLVLVALGMSYVQMEKGHVRVELFLQRFSINGKNILEIFGLLMMLAFSIFITWSGGIRAFDSLALGSTTTIASIPKFWADLMVPIGFGWFCLQLLADLSGSVVSLLKSSIK